MNFNDERIRSRIPLKCSKCGGAKYIDEPYVVSGAWYTDVCCLNCGHSKDILVDDLKAILVKLEKASK